jgi:uncharacterized repeat protein (TIGR03803 family)
LPRVRDSSSKAQKPKNMNHPSSKTMPALGTPSFVVRPPRTLHHSILFLAAFWLLGQTPVPAAIQAVNIFSFNGTNGSRPAADLLCLSNGLIYGTTAFGGTSFASNASGNGTVFEYNPASGTMVSEFSFGGTNGGNPLCALIQGQDGNLYGTTYGGNPGYGSVATVFRISTNLVFTNLDFLQGINGPAAGLVQWTNGSLFGVSYQGGSFSAGQLFIITTNASSFSQFSFGNIGQSGFGDDPWGGLTLGSGGVIYGTTSSSGANNYGTIFTITSGSSISTVFSFNGTNGAVVEARLLVGLDGYLYGTTCYGGTNGYGTVFKFNPTNNALATLYSFANGADGAYPAAGLVEVTNGVFYGTTSSTNGGIYQITSAGTFSVICPLIGTNGNSSLAGLVRGSDGNFYGTTSEGGAFGQGTIFRLSTLDTTPPSFQKPKLANGMFSVSASAVSGQSYQLQYKTNLTQSNWINTGNPITATNGAVNISDAMTASKKFYRVQLQP